MEMRADNKPKRDAPMGSRAAILRRLFGCMVRWRGLYFAMLGMLALSLACELALPLVIERAVNAITFAGGLVVDRDALAASVGLFVLLVALNAVLGSAQARISARITLNMARRLREDAVASLLDTSVASFEGLRRGDLMSRVMNDVEIAASAFTESFAELASALVVVVGCAAIMFARCAPLAGVSVGVGAASVLVMGALSGLVFPLVSKRQAALGQLNAHVEESLKAFRTCKAGGRAAENNRRMEALSEQYCAQSLRACRLEYLLGPVMLVLGNLNFLLTVAFGASKIISGAITVGTMQAFIMYSRQFMEPLNAMSEHFIKGQSALAGAERVFRLIDIPKEALQIAEAGRGQSGADAEGAHLRFEDVRFAYHRNLPVLRGLSLCLEKGERLALVGRTGAGKTTLSHLLLLFHADYEGRILLDGREIRTMDPAALRRDIAAVSQEPQIVEGTVYDNLTYGCEGVGRGDVEGLIGELGVRELFDRLPHGLDTQMRGIGENMSQGQLQLVCLIRALLRRASILILDEATSSMDPETEAAIKRGMDAAMAGRTSIVIAHRLSTVRDADHIAVLSDGVISEYGTHEQLMAMDGVYRGLYHTQLLGKEI